VQEGPNANRSALSRLKDFIIYVLDGAGKHSQRLLSSGLQLSRKMGD
jgi:hypothetical protein